MKFHKQIFTLIDEWTGLSMEDIRTMEKEVKKELDQVYSGALFGRVCRN